MGGSSARSGLIWGTGTAAAVAVMGPALLPGSVFALDATFVDRIPVPAGIWGLGPELPRRVPFGAVLAWASSGVLGAVAGRVLLGVALTVAFVGAARLASRSGRVVTAITAGLLFALSPLVLTRVGAGQWTAVLAFALLPWALPSLLVPGDRPARTFLWAAALGATGSVGGTLAVLAVLVGLAAERSRAALVAVALVAVAQLTWVVPGLVVGTGGARPPGAEAFVTRADGPVGAAALFAGHGFWRAPTQVGGDANLGIALVAVGLLGLAVVGASALPPAWRWRALALAALGLIIALASAVPGVRGPFGDITRTTPGAAFREGQRALVLTLVWLAPAAALGAARLARASPGRRRGWAMLATPVAAALVLAGPGLWGVGGRLAPVELPPEWARAREAVRRAPGTVVALPYHRYLDLPVAGDRRVFNPVPDYFGGDVVNSSDPELGAGYRELVDPREPNLRRLLAGARDGEPVAGGLAALGVRWVVLLHAADWVDYRALARDPGMRVVVSGESLDLLAVGAWSGSVVDADGRAVPTDPVVAPLQGLAASGEAVWARPGADGWLRGFDGAGSTASGLLRLPAGRGPVWFWPALVVLLADAIVAAGVLGAWRSLRRDAAADRPLTVSSQGLPRDAAGHVPLQPTHVAGAEMSLGEQPDEAPFRDSLVTRSREVEGGT